MQTMISVSRFRSLEQVFYRVGMPGVPVQHVADPDREEHEGWSGRNVTRHRLIVRLVWDDGSESEIETTALAWTRTHVLIEFDAVGFIGSWAGPKRVWVRAKQVRRNRRRGRGEMYPDPDNPGWLTMCVPTHCGRGHKFPEINNAKFHHCGCRRRVTGENGHLAWSCPICHDIVWGYGHDPDWSDGRRGASGRPTVAAPWTRRRARTRDD